MLKKIKILVLISLLILMPIKTNAVEATVEQQINAVIETALAYKNQGNQIQYDSFRKNLYLTPEDATSQHYSYTVCSGFTFSVYYQTLGIELPEESADLLKYAAKHKDKENGPILYYYNKNTSDVDSSVAFQNFLNDMIYEIKPGDIFVNTGHAMMVENVDIANKSIKMIQANGDRYDVVSNHIDVYEQEGAISRYSMSSLKSDKDEFALIRIINETGIYYTGYEDDDSSDEFVKYTGITESAQSRLNYPGIDIEKISSQNGFVNIGDSITYEITIKNNGDSNYSSFDVIENIDSNLTVIDQGNGILDGNSLKWTVSSLNVGESKKISYTVKVNNEKTLLGKIIVSTGKVDNIATSRIETLIGNTFTDEQNNNIKNAFYELKEDENNELTEREFINEVYKKAFNNELDLGLNIKNLDIMSISGSVVQGGYDELSVKWTKLNDTSVKKYIYNNFYGFRLSKKTENNTVNGYGHWNIKPSFELNDRARTITPDMLNDGDIILLYTGDTNSSDTTLVDKSYIYLDTTLFRKKPSNEFEEISSSELTEFLRNIVGDNYVILKPSIALIEEEEAEPSIPDTGENDGDTTIPDTGGEDNEEIENPNTGIYYRYGILVFAILISTIVYLFIRKKSLFVRHD